MLITSTGYVFVTMQDNIQIHLKAGKGPIFVRTCDIGTGDATAEKSGCFLTLEESRIKTNTLHTGNAKQKTVFRGF